MPLADRTTLLALTSNLDPGDVADPALRLAFFRYMTDLSDANWNYVLSLVAGGVVSPYPPGDYNKLINGNFALNQRAKSGTVTLAAGAYGHDRWKAGAAGCTYTFATVNNITTITITAGSLIQVIEGINLFTGTYTLSWTGTAQGKIGAGSYGATGITGTATGGTNLNIEFNIGTLSKAQFNVGIVALPFQLRSYSHEILDSLRYRCQSWADSAVSPAVGSIGCSALTTSALAVNVRFTIPMRTSPTITVQNNNVANQVRNSSTNAAVSATLSSVSGQSNKGFSILTFSGTPFTVGQYYDFDILADAEL
jgi:hypothetical protein